MWLNTLLFRGKVLYLWATNTHYGQSRLIREVVLEAFPLEKLHTKIIMIMISKIKEDVIISLIAFIKCVH